MHFCCVRNDKPYFQIVSESDSSATVLINGGISQWGDNSNRRITNEITLLDAKYDKITFLINSGGGQVNEGIAIYNAIKSAKAQTTGLVVGIAASIAGIILQACDNRSARKMTQIMTHKFSGGAYGSSAQMREMADLMDTWENDVLDELVERTGKSKDVVNTWFEEGKDKWFTPQQALEAGLIDSIDDSKADKAPKNLSNNIEGLYNFYHQSVVNEFTETKPKEIKMRKEHLAIIGLQEGASDGAIEAALNGLVSTSNAAKKQLEEHAEAVIENLVKAGKIADDKDSKNFAVNTYMANPKGFSALMGVENVASAAQAQKPTDLIHASGTRKPLENSGGEDRSKWTLETYMEKDPEALDAMEDADYEALVNKSK